MTGYLTTVDGEVWRLPPLLSWDVVRTDGTACDSAAFTFLYEPNYLSVLKKAHRFRLAEEETTVLCGVVDDFSARVGDSGRLVTLNGRGMGALLLDNQLRAAEFASLQREDAIARFVRPFGITKVQGGAMAPVADFSVTTGMTAWQALCGYCLHSAGCVPRFSADGTLLLDGGRHGAWRLPGTAAFQGLTYERRRYGVISRQLMLSGSRVAADVENAPFIALGGSALRVDKQSGKGIRATWRTAAQRVADSMKNAALLTVTLGGRIDCEPGDTVTVEMAEHGITGRFRLRSCRESYLAGQRSCLLELEGEMD